ncbi:MAG: uracil-DNA glycosylase [Candidatus Absconditabacterales bacterium]|nr:uracil-DNA glycosylase [Candidatus Absconditabacterales bacterium]
MDTSDIQIDPSRKKVLKEEFQKPYFLELKNFLKKEKAEGKIIYPEGKNIFNAYNSTPFHKVKVVIIGQDPYHGPGQAHGLCFSVLPGIKTPPSLQNIFKELKNDLSIEIPKNGYLQNRAEQGVFMINSSLTVRKGEPMSHDKIGREIFTDETIKKLSDKKEGLIFLLRGAFAQKKKTLIDTKRHHVLKASHPSPFSVHKGFFGCKHFSKTNEILKKNGKNEIDRKIN